MIISPALIKVRCTGDNIKFQTCNQAVHPSIVYNSRKKLFIIGITPYPYGNARFENPSIVYSRDLNVLEDYGSSNPLLPPPPDSNVGGHYADPEIFYYNGRLHMLIGVTSKALKMDGYLYFTVDSLGRRTSEPVFIDIPFSKNVSISVICEVNDCYYWTVNPGVKPFEVTLYHVTKDSFPHPSGRMKVRYEISYGEEEWNIWHFSVRKTDSGKYLLLAAANPVGSWNGSPPMHLFLLSSNDGLFFEDAYNKPIIEANNLSRTRHLYRSDFIVLNNTIEGVISYSTTGVLGVVAEKYKGSLLQKSIMYLYKKVGKHSYRKWLLAKFAMPWKHGRLSEKSSNVIT